MISVINHSILLDGSLRKELANKEHFEKRVNERIMNEGIILNRVRIFRNYSIGGGLTEKSRNGKLYKERCINPTDLHLKNSKTYINRAERKYPSLSDDKGNSQWHHSKEDATVKTEQSDDVEQKVLFLVKKKEMIVKIMKQRKTASSQIIKRMRGYSDVIKENKKLIIEKILNLRKKNSIIIQKSFRAFVVRKHINELRKDYDFVLFYNYIEKSGLAASDAQKCPNINVQNPSLISNYNNRLIKIREIKLKFGKDGNEYLFKYSKILNEYYLPLKKHGVMRKRFKVNFIVNGNTIIDPHYEVDNDRNGYFYNIIESSMFWKKIHNPLMKKPLMRETKKKSKFWENIFEIKRHMNHSYTGTSSVSDMSEQNDAFIEKLLINNSNNRSSYNSLSKKLQLKSILKPRKGETSATTTATLHSSSDGSIALSQKLNNKKVSFNDVVQFSY